MRVAIIPARGGSKRVPRKNIRPFAGKPMLAHSIAAAHGSGLFDRVVVSTDDSEIAEVAQAFGAEVPFLRPASLADDFAGTHAVVAHAVRWLQEHGDDISEACCIYATAPFVEPADIRAGLALLLAGDWASVFAATTFPFPIYRAFEQTESGGLRMVFPGHYTTRSQDLPEALHDAGQFYWARSADWLAPPDGFGPRSTIVRIPRWRVQDIDTPEDWRRAELLWAVLRAERTAGEGA